MECEMSGDLLADWSIGTGCPWDTARSCNSSDFRWVDLTNYGIFGVGEETLIREMIEQILRVNFQPLCRGASRN